MTDAAFSLPTLGHGPEYRDAYIWLPQLMMESARDGQGVIEGRTFINCTLEGPAVLAALDGWVFEGCFFGEVGDDPGSLLLHTLGERSVAGVIPFRDCKFVGCNFRAVGFTGNRPFLEEMLRVLREVRA
jgi:hypothetical protein